MVFNFDRAMGQSPVSADINSVFPLISCLQIPGKEKNHRVVEA